MGDIASLFPAAATISGDATPTVDDRTPLFSALPFRRTQGARYYHVAPDGRFLMMRPPSAAGTGDAEAATPQINVVLNWFEELNTRAPADR